MRQDLAERSAFAAAADEDLFGVRVAKHGRVDKRFVVDVLVPFRGLGFAVQNQAAAEKFGVQDFDLLVGGLAGVVDLTDLENH